MMKTFQLLVGLCLLIGAQLSLACSCFDIPCTFLDNEFGPQHHVVHVRVIGEEQMEGESRYAQMNNKLTRLLVLKDFTDNMMVDTILFYHGDGAMCFMSLSPIEIAQEYILRISLLEEKKANDSKEHIYCMELCSRPVLYVSNNRVSGMISKNKSCTRRKRVIAEQLARPDANGVIDYSKLPKPKERKRLQRMSVRKFGKVWNRFEGSRK